MTTSFVTSNKLVKLMEFIEPKPTVEGRNLMLLKCHLGKEQSQRYKADKFHQHLSSVGQ